MTIKSYTILQHARSMNFKQNQLLLQDDDNLKHTHTHIMSQPHFGINVRVNPTLSRVGTWSPPGLPKIQSSSSGVKTPRIEVFFIPLEKVLKCRCPKWHRMSHLDICSPSYGPKKGRESNWQVDSRPLKVGTRALLDFCSGSAT
jgi:hypothetical protein